MFATVYHWANVVCSILACVLCVFIHKKVIAYNKTLDYDYKGVPLVIWGVSVSFGLAFLIINFVTHIKLALMVTLAPRIYLLTQFLSWFK